MILDYGRMCFSCYYGTVNFILEDGTIKNTNVFSGAGNRDEVNSLYRQNKKENILKCCKIIRGELKILYFGFGKKKVLKDISQTT